MFFYKFFTFIFIVFEIERRSRQTVKRQQCKCAKTLCFCVKININRNKRDKNCNNSSVVNNLQFGEKCQINWMCWTALVALENWSVANEPSSSSVNLQFNCHEKWLKFDRCLFSFLVLCGIGSFAGNSSEINKEKNAASIRFAWFCSVAT